MAHRGKRRSQLASYANSAQTKVRGIDLDARQRFVLGTTWKRRNWRVSAKLNYRAPLDNVLLKNDSDGCATHYADGSDAPGGYRIASFTTVDLTGRWLATPQLEVSASVQNLFDKVAPLDPLTYGTTGYNPLDDAGAAGWFISAGLKYKF